MNSGPLGQLRVAGVHTRFVFHQVAAEQHFFFFHPGNGVATGVAVAGAPDLHVHTAEVDGELAGHFALGGVAAANDQGGPGEAGHRVGTAEQAGEALHFALHVLGAALLDELQRALAGDDFGGAFGQVGAGTQHAHSVVVGEQRRGGGGVSDHDVFVTNDDARVGVAFGGVGPAMGAELFEGDLFVFQVGLGCEGFAHGGSPVWAGNKSPYFT